MDLEMFDVIVVGAGWYGLIAAHTYLKLAPETKLLIVDDSDTVGGVWSQERIYPTLFAQISHPLFEYSFYPMSKDRISPDGFISGQTIHEYLDSFATKYGLKPHLRLQTRVTMIDRTKGSMPWRLSVQNGAPLVCNKLIYATGANSTPIVPNWPRNDFIKPVIHSLETGKHLQYITDNVKRATVVGRSKSSYDTVYQLLKAGKEVDWVMRNGSSGPFSIYGPSFLGLWNIADHISTRLASSFSPCIWSASDPWHRCLHQTTIGRTITDIYWRVANYISVAHAGYSKSEDAEKLRPRPYSDGVFWGSGGIGIATVPNFWKTFHSSDIKIHSTEVLSLSHKDVVTLKNGYAIPTDMVIHCTGFEKGYNTFNSDLQQELGLSTAKSKEPEWDAIEKRANQQVDKLFPVLKHPPKTEYDTSVGKRAPQRPNLHYRRLVVPSLAARNDRSILFPGHIHSAFTPLAAELQALWGVSWMLGETQLPSLEDMQMEAALFNSWTGKRYLEQGQKHAYFIYDYIAYIDTLMKDLGLNPYRKKSMFEEIFVRYKPSDYRGLIDEYLAIRNGK